MQKSTIKKHYNIFMLGLSLFVLAELAVDIIYSYPPQIESVITKVDLGICLVFLCDWLFFFFKSTDKRRYALQNSLDLIGAIPFYEGFRLFRIVRAVRILKAMRMLRGLKGAMPIFRVLAKNPMRSAISVYFSVTLLVYFYCSLGIYHFEKGVNEKFTSFGEALWCAFTSLTTVGYGDLYPITWEGRIMAGVLVLTGLGFFSLLTAEIAAQFMKYLKQSAPEGK